LTVTNKTVTLPKPKPRFLAEENVQSFTPEMGVFVHFSCRAANEFFDACTSYIIKF